MSYKHTLAFTIFTLFGIAIGILACHYLNGFSRTENQIFQEVQRGHLRRLDRASADGRVVFLGSSTFQGLDISAITPAGLNLSMGGDTLPSLIERASGYKSLKTARAVVINIGLNDLTQHCNQQGMNLSDLFKLIPDRTPVIAVGIQEIKADSRFCEGSDMSKAIARLNLQISEDCNARSGCSFVESPVGHDMRQPEKASWLEEDGIHLSNKGYKTLSSKIKIALERAEDRATRAK